MFAHFQANSAASRGRCAVSFRKRLVLVSGVVGLCLLTAACVATLHEPYAGSDPSDPDVSVPAVRYRPTTGGYTSFARVVITMANRRTAPTPKAIVR